MSGDRKVCTYPDEDGVLAVEGQQSTGASGYGKALEQRWMARLFKFNFKICFRPGQSNTNAAPIRETHEYYR